MTLAMMVEKKVKGIGVYVEGKLDPIEEFPPGEDGLASAKKSLRERGEVLEWQDREKRDFGHPIAVWATVIPSGQTEAQEFTIRWQLD